MSFRGCTRVSVTSNNLFNSAVIGLVWQREGSRNSSSNRATAKSIPKESSEVIYDYFDRTACYFSWIFFSSSVTLSVMAKSMGRSFWTALFASSVRAYFLFILHQARAILRFGRSRVGCCIQPVV